MAPRSASQFDPLDSHPNDRPGEKTGSGSKAAELSVVDATPSDHLISQLKPPSEDPGMQEIVEEAQRLTGASAAALALRLGNDIVCRASTGASAPPLGAPLNQDSGLSGACIRNRTFQRCDDTDTDPRVDAALCRRLGIRSILVFPILLQDELLGLVEVFSPKPKTFADIYALQSLSRLIVNRLVYLAQAALQTEPAPFPAAEPDSPAEPNSLAEQDSAILPPSEPLDALPLPPPEVGADYWTAALIFMIIAVALALGWMLRLDVQRSSRASARKTARAAAPARPSAEAPASTSPVPAPTPAKQALVASSSGPKPIAPDNSIGSDLVVSQNGKVLYREVSPDAASVQSSQPPSSSGGQLTISSDKTDQYVAHRVAPEYPEQARREHVQGPVTLQVSVDRDGAVKDLKTMSGDPQLAAAASAAVKKWRFKPFLQNGSPAGFQTLVTVVFRLP